MTRSPRRLKDQVQETVSELPIHAARLAVMGVGQALLLTDRVRKDYKEARESGLAPVLGRLIDDAEDLTGRLVGKVTGRAEPDGRVGAPGGAAPSPTGSEISVGKPAAAGRTRPATGRTKPSTRPTAAPAKGTAAAPAKRRAAKPAKPSTAKPTTAESARKRTTPPAAESTPSAGRRTPPAKGTAPAAPAKAPASPTAPAKEEKPSTSTAAASGPATAAPRAGAASGRELPITDYDQASIASVRARLRNLNARQVNELRDYERAHSARAEFLRMYENRIAKLRSQS